MLYCSPASNTYNVLCSHWVISNSFATVAWTTAWTVACQAPLTVEFFSQEYWSCLPFPSPGDFPDPGIEPESPALAGRFCTPEPPGKPLIMCRWKIYESKSFFFLPLFWKAQLGGVWYLIWGYNFYYFWGSAAACYLNFLLRSYMLTNISLVIYEKPKSDGLWTNVLQWLKEKKEQFQKKKKSSFLWFILMYFWNLSSVNESHL